MAIFRELRRKNKELPLDECIELLKSEKRGVLSVLGDCDYPYGMPMNHFYHEADGMIYFHCGASGHREDALKRHNKVSFCVYDKGSAAEGEWALTIRSVIVFGTIEMVKDPETVVNITARLCRKFTEDEAYIEEEIRKHAHKTILLKLSPQHICGKLVTES